MTKNLWLLIHHLVAHPLLGVATVLHDLTGKKAWP